MTSPKQSYSRIILLFIMLLMIGGGELYAQCTNSCPVITNVNINSCEGVISISVTGDGPFTYDWRDSGGTQVSTSFVAGGLTPDNYTVVVTDADGDTETATYTVTNPPNLNGSVVVNDVTCRGDADAQVVVTMNNGNPDYSWELFNGVGASIGTGSAPPFSTTITLNGLGVDNYTLTVTDDNGCTGNITFSVTEPADFLGFSIGSSNDATCFNSTDGSISATGTGGWGNYVYQWERVSDGAVVGTSATVTGLAPGDYRLVITDRNGTGCTITTPIQTIGSPPEIVPTAVVNDAQCNGASDGAINLSVTGGVGPFSYSWSNGATTQDISGLTAGSYTVTITDNAGCSDVSTYVVGEPAVLTINPNVTNVACFGDATGVIESNVSGGTAPYNYVWSNGATSADISSLSAGTYDLTVTDQNGCSTTLNNITVTEPTSALSKQSDALTDPSCAGYNDGSVTITMQGGTAPYSYSWSNGDNTATASNLTAGLHTVTVTDNAGCTFSETFTLTDPPSITVSSSLTEPTCNGAADGEITVSASNGIAPYIYNWSTGDTGPTISGLVAGTYTVTVTDQNGAGCTVVETINLGQPAVLNDNATVNDISCNGANDGSIFLAVTGGTGPYSYSWSNGATTNNISGLSAGPYSVTIEDDNGCTIVRNYNIVDPPAIGVSHTQVDILCKGAFTGEIDITPSGGTAPYTYSWSNGSTAQDLVNVAAGSYTVRVTDDEGCFVDFTLTEPATVMNLSGTETDGTCAGSNNGSIDLSVTGGTGPYTYLWNTGATSEDISGLAPGNYSVTVEDAGGCVKSIGFTISEPSPITVSKTLSNVTCNGNADGTISLSVGGGTGSYTYSWADDGSITTKDRTGLGPGNYTITVEDASGCLYVESFNITEPAILSSTATQLNVSCFGESTGSIDLAISGGSTPYTFLWSNGALTEDLTNIPAGNYSVTITDAKGCTDSKSFTITEPASALSVTNSVSQITCNGAADGAINLTVSGGSAPYSYNWSHGSTAEDLSNLSAGNYTVVVTDDKGCTYTESFLITDPPVLTLTKVLTDVDCNGAANGTIDITVGGGEGPYTFAWSNGATTEDLTNLGPGSYSVTVTDVRGCTISDSYTISQPTALGFSYTSDDVSCFGFADGAIDITVTGGTAPYNYSWSNGEITEDINALSVGDYTVTVTDFNGCTFQQTIAITQPAAPLSDTGIATDISCFGGSDGRIELNPAGGTAPYTYSWSNGATTKDISGLVDGNYQVTITDDNNCSITKSFTISMPPAMLASGTQTNILCNGDATGAIDLTVSGGTTPYTYTWSNGATTQDLSNITAGNYQVTISDASGCTLVRNFTITEPLALLVGENVQDVSCFGVSDGFIDLSVSGGIAPYSYSWSNGATTQDLFNISGGNYSVDITDGNGCVTTKNYTIAEPASALGVTGIVTDENCFGDSQGAISLTVTGGTAPYSYSWNHGPTIKDVAGLGRGAYQVTVTDNSGCSVTTNYTISGPDALQLSAVPTQIDCNGAANGELDVTVLGGTAPYTYTWSNGASVEDINNLAPGNYSLTVTDDNGCTISGSWTITQPLAISIGQTTTHVSCFGASDGAIDITVSGGISPYTYNWSNGATTQDLNGISGGNYTLTVTDANGCVSSGTYTVVEPSAALTVNGSVSDEICFGDNQGAVSLTVAGGTAPYTYSWNNGATTKDIAGLGTGTYQVTVTDANGCFVQTNFTVGGPAALTATSSLTNVSCNGATDGAIDITPTGGTAPYLFSWSNGATTEDITGLAPGNYLVTITDDNGCAINRNYTITQPTAIGITSSKADVTCFGAGDGSISVSVIGGTLPYTYSWSNGQTTKNLSGLSGGSYTLTVTDGNACTSTLTVVVDEPTNPLAATGIVTDETCFGDSQGAIDLTVSGGTAPYSYSWNHGPSGQDVTGLARGTYQVTVTDANGCSVVESFVVSGPDALQLSAIATQVDCNGAANGELDVTVLGGTAPYSYSWSNGSTSEDLTRLSPNNYNLTVTDANGCTVSGSWTITQPLAISVGENITDVACFGEGDGAIDLTVSGGVGGYTYLWSTGATTQDISGLSGGNYSVTITDANSCVSVYNYTVNEPTAALSVTGSVSDELCFGDSQGAITLTVGGGTGPYTYLWDHGSTSKDVSNLARGNYEVIVTDANGCSETANFTVGGPTALQLSAVTTQVNCNGAANGAIDVTVTGGSGPYTYLWNNGATTEDISGLSPGNRSLTVTDANGCTVSGSWTITQPLAISVGENITDVACFGEGDGAIDLTVSGGVGGYTYLWSTGATTQDISGLSGGNYSVTITDANSCVSVYNYTVNEPTAALSVTGSVSDELCFGDSQGAITLTVGGGTGPYTYLWDHGSTSKDVSNLARGNYEVIVTDANGCSETANFTVGGPTALQLSAVTTQVNCNGAANGAIDVTVTGGSGPYTYLWNNGATTEDISGLSPGNRSLTVTDANGCTVSGSWTITQPLVVSVSRTITDVTCFGASDGAIDLSVSGGITPYSYSWSNGATTQDISGLSGGTYSVTITDGNGCTSLKTYVVSEPSAALSISGTVTDENCYGDNQGAISLNVTGGTAPYSYSWNQGSITKDISALGQGVYQVTVTDANGCFVQSDFTVSGPAVLSATGSTTQVSCNGAADGAIDIEVVGGTSPYTFAWGHGETSEDLSGLSPGNYAVVITDANGCSISRNYSITQPNALGITHTVTDVDCFGANNGAISVNVVGGTLPYTYSWSNGATSRNISSLAGGSYDITVTDGNGCSLVQTIVVEEPTAALSLNASVTDELCFGDNQGAIDLTVTGGSAPFTFQWNNGSSSEDIFGLESGSYLVTVTDKNGCSISETYTVSSPNMLSVSGAVSPISCNSADDGALDITVTGGTGPYTYSWNHGETTEDLTNLSPGTYVLTVTDANGCIAAGNWTLTEPLPLTINHVKEDVTCFGADDGYINLTVSGGTLPYTYTWSNGATGKDLTDLAGGTYEVTITDARGCQQVKQIVVNAPTAALSASPTIVDALCNGLPTGEVQLAVAGGTTPYSYQWSNGSNQRDLKNVFAGNYAVTITDAKGCSIVENYTVGEPDELDVTFDVTNTSCQGDSDGAIAVTTTGGTAPYNYVWSNGSTSKDLSNIAGGTYNLTITDANGCSITRSVEVDDSKDLSVEVQKADVLCKGESTGQIYLNIAGGTGVYDISWSNGSTSAVLENLPAGVYSATVADANNCSTSVTVVISEPSEELSLTLSDYKDLLCYGDDSGFMRANPQGGVAPYTYLWSNGARTSQISNLKAGTYTVTVTDANGCIVQSQATINQPDKPITISSQGKLNLSCKGDNDGRIVVDVEGGTGLYEFVWSTGARTSSIENLSVGDYTLRVTDANGCVQERVFTINEPEELTIEDALVNESQCYDDRNGSIELDISGGVEPYSYQWSTGATSKNLIGITSGDYSVLITDANGCQIQANYTLDEPALFRMEPTMTDISCIGANDASISLNIEGGIEPVAIRWSTGESSETISELGPGEYNVLVTDDKGCTIQQTFNVIEPLDLTLDAYIEDATRCNDPRSGRVNVIVSGGTEPYTYRWSNGATTSEITDVLPGTYVVRVRDRYNCEVQGTYTVLQPEPLQIGLSTEPYIDCENRIAGMLVKANVKGGVGNYRYEWSKGNSVKSEVLMTEPGRLTIEVFDDRGCYQQNSIDIDVPELGVADFEYNAESIDRTGDLASNDPVSFFDLSEGEVIDWHWDFGDGFDSDEIDPIHTYDAPGTYIVRLVVTDRTGCETEKVSVLEITEGYKVIVPNAFTPNGDGNNDFFRPRMLGLVKSKLIIYNTWGEVIFSTDDIETKGWDGTIKGRKAENGNYVYKIIGLSFNGLKVEREGIFALIN